MSTGGLVLFLDYVDPLSYLLEAELSGARSELGLDPPRRSALELRPPPEPLLHPADPRWTERWASALPVAAERDLALREPTLVPWTRKAHELVRYAASEGRGDAAHHAVFDAYLRDGHDIGRIDVLLEIARGLGLALQSTRVVLDVDRYAADVSTEGAHARSLGIGAPPALALGTRILEGFHNRDTLRTFLCSR